ncbi:hypothetical protein PCANC_21261 [Puccinia coronata f. sp. avenae]|uniref:DNA polymerase kappa n=1 Tax=Puccinia coronata f. sp. avenae TaxID=200324 RepID=A0A2N5U7N3_9BASI|nr:hypothetical protein PCANC_21261 [Puccinia coronata f. sp. avenae]PLW33726.1 hypothetical protein PCASD_12499 [Puccinia coronata f. sp. avenae]
MNQQQSSSSSVPQSLLRRLEGPSSNKAGLIRDPEQVASIIYEASKGSKYFLNEQAKDARLTAQIEQLRNKLNHQLTIRRNKLDFEQQQAQQISESLEKNRVLDQIIVCVDADAFFCSVEEMYDPTLKGKAFAVGSNVLTTASYEARKWGCRSAMAGYIATKLCPHLIFVEPDFSKYQAASESIMNILRQYDPNLAPHSLDECYMNLTMYCRDHNLSAAEATSLMRQHVLKDTGLTVSAGIGPNVMISKIAADLNKPNGQFECPSTRDDAMKFMKDLPVRKVPGIGRVTERWLEVLDVKTCGDIWDQRAKLMLMRSEISFDLLLKAYMGLGQTDIKPSQREDRQSVGCETSFKCISEKDDFFQKLKELSEQLAGDLSRLHFAGRTLTLKIKLDTFEVLSRSITPAVLGQRLLSSAEDLYKHAKHLLEREIESRHASFSQGKRVLGCKGARDMSIRLLGIKLSHLHDQKDLHSTEGNSLHKWISNPTASTQELQTVKPTVNNKNDVEVNDGHDGEWKCPICNLHMVADDLQTMNEHVDLCLWKSSEEGMRAIEEDQEDARGMMTHQHNSKETSGSETKRKLDQHKHASTSTSASSSASSAKRAKSNRSSGCSTSRKKSSKAVSILDWCQKPSGK